MNRPKKPIATLATLAKRFGFKLRLDDAPELSPDLIGDPGEAGDTDAQACLRNVISVKRDKQEPKLYCWHYAYSVAHEIAEVRHGFRHVEETWTHQCNVLATWVQELGSSLDTMTLMFELEREKVKLLEKRDRRRSKTSKKKARKKR